MGQITGHEEQSAENPRFDRYRRALARVFDDGHLVGFLSTWVAWESKWSGWRTRKWSGGHDVPHWLLVLSDDSVADCGSSWLDDEGDAAMDLADFDHDVMTRVSEGHEPELWAEEYAGDDSEPVKRRACRRLLPVALVVVAISCLAIGLLPYFHRIPFISFGFAITLGIANVLIGLGFLVAVVGIWIQPTSPPRRPTPPFIP